ncbi:MULTISPECIES: chorismate synthase [Myroides]|uniref:Chorismate synthase n=1 Tax=Myroides albus TaxID=2562892 RepID=A0A6I3LPD5_9FLAO|nr:MULTISPECIES: chorismate synthase [Myroides]MTG97835.1 chorismate synthase [Myroides albus]MVX35957.1 chorismate synthase [Myroides sp. LoEW2-1]UVD79792.1 chorismate synthase [Myroides albus]
MAGNTFGNRFRVTTFGESHGDAIGGVIDGCPAGIELDLVAVQRELDRRKPGQSKIVTQRKEADEVRFLSGIFEGKTTGTPIGFIIENTNSKSKDYDHIKDIYRPSHADYVYDKKYGHRDHRGGGRSSARETACRVVAGAIAKQVLGKLSITAFVSSVGEIKVTAPYTELDFNEIENNPVRCADPLIAKQMEQLIKEVKKDGDSIGGTITCVIQGVPVGLGEPVFDRLDAELAKAMIGINAVKGVEFGLGFEATRMKGSEHNDEILPNGLTKTNNAGGIVGGISNGMDIYFRVAFKPTATLMKDQLSINTQNEVVTVQGKGRHDACVLPRAVPIVEAMAAIVMLDMYIEQYGKLKM